MSAAPWMPFYVADYLADTCHLTTLEHGAYLLLIMHYWRTSRLPADSQSLAAIVRMPEREWAKIAGKMAGLFQDGWKHGRIDLELAKSASKSFKRAGAGRTGGLARAASMAGKSEAIAKILLEQNPTDAQASSSQPQSQEKELPVVAPKNFRGSRLPDDWMPSQAGGMFAAEALGGIERSSAELLKFRDYWRAKPGAAGVKLDWEATWRNWVRSAAERGPRGGPPPKTDQRFNALIELQKEANFDRDELDLKATYIRLSNDQART